MRSLDQRQQEIFCTVSIEELIPTNHPLRSIRRRADAALQRMTAESNGLYAERGRPGIAPEQLLRALLLQVLYGFRNERRLMEEMRSNFALRWFIGLTMGRSPGM